MDGKQGLSWLYYNGGAEGHDSLTSMRHYQGLASSDDELRDIKKQLIAWGFSL